MKPLAKLIREVILLMAAIAAIVAGIKMLL